MKSIAKLVEQLDMSWIIGEMSRPVVDVCYDSRLVKKNSMFVAIIGYVTDGHTYIPQAIEAGASCVMMDEKQSLYEKHKLEQWASEHSVTFIEVASTRRALAHVSAQFFDQPSLELSLLGVTGTKGKTTTTFMTKAILEKDGRSSGLIGTVFNVVGKKTNRASRTTPESYDLQKMLRQMLDAGQHEVCMEVSSQGLMLERVHACNFCVGAFTNLYHDHISATEHKDMQDYLKAKLMLFDQSQIALINADCDVVKEVLSYAKAHCQEVMTFGFSEGCDLRATKIEACENNGRLGTQFYLESPWYCGQLFVGMPGLYSVENALCAIGMAASVGASFDAIRCGLKHASVPGRMQLIGHSKDYLVYVDYAHNASSLEHLLTTLRAYAKARIITVFGCGGDRAISRRYEMGEISGRYSDYSIVTSDNPRSEDPQKIIADILVGISKTSSDYCVEDDRRRAIAKAFDMARKDDIVVIAGKGHEDYQEFKDRTIHFDDAKIAEELLNIKRKDAT